GYKRPSNYHLNKQKSNQNKDKFYSNEAYWAFSSYLDRKSRIEIYNICKQLGISLQYKGERKTTILLKLEARNLFRNQPQFVMTIVGKKFN
ncbi:MAG: hypothetical protein ACFBSE_20585, partial [Prochloraceae cyanobacterium]